MDLFKDILPSIQKTKKDLSDEPDFKKSYNAFVVNRALSYHVDSILHANEMNSRHHLDKKLQYDFFLNTIRSQKRPFAKWIKTEKSEDLECIKQVFGLSNEKAREAMRLLSNEQIQKLKEQTDTGGLRK